MLCNIFTLRSVFGARISRIAPYIIDTYINVGIIYATTTVLQFRSSFLTMLFFRSLFSGSYHRVVAIFAHNGSSNKSQCVYGGLKPNRENVYFFFHSSQNRYVYLNSDTRPLFYFIYFFSSVFIVNTLSLLWFDSTCHHTALLGFERIG